MTLSKECTHAGESTETEKYVKLLFLRSQIRMLLQEEYRVSGDPTIVQQIAATGVRICTACVMSGLFDDRMCRAKANAITHILDELEEDEPLGRRMEFPW